MNESRLQEIERQLAELKSVSFQRAGQFEMPLDPTTQAILAQHVTPTTNAFPVGAVYISTTATNPSATLGYGTWEAFGVGRCLVGYDSNQVEFNALEGEGGEKEHTLTISEMPEHKHDGVTYNEYVRYTGGPSVTRAATSGSTTTSNYTDGIAPQGGGDAHNNLQPYIVVNFWKRTA